MHMPQSHYLVGSKEEFDLLFDLAIRTNTIMKLAWHISVHTLGGEWDVQVDMQKYTILGGNYLVPLQAERSTCEKLADSRTIQHNTSQYCALQVNWVFASHSAQNNTLLQPA
jgi:hypothetical protein